MAAYKHGRKSGTQNLIPCSKWDSCSDKHVYCIRRLLEAYTSTFPMLILSSTLWYSYPYNGSIDYNFSLSYGPITLIRGQKESGQSQCKLECCIIQEITLLGADRLEPYTLDDWYEAAELSDEKRSAVLLSFLNHQTSVPIRLDQSTNLAVERIISNLPAFLDFYFFLIDTVSVFTFAVSEEMKFSGHEIDDKK